MFAIKYVKSFAADLAELRAHNRTRLLDSIEAQLLHEPVRPSRNRKPLLGLVSPWDYIEPVWELRIGEYRVFYDVDVATSVVTVRALRHKPPHKTTEQIL